MNILITLPHLLVEKIISGEKKFEMRKCLPKNMKIGQDGFFVVEKGTNNIRCWCRVDYYMSPYVDSYNASRFTKHLCVSGEYIARYAKNDKIYLWRIGKVIVFKNLKREELFVDRNPQQFAYCPLSYGESY